MQLEYDTKLLDRAIDAYTGVWQGARSMRNLALKTFGEDSRPDYVSMALGVIQTAEYFIQDISAQLLKNISEQNPQLTPNTVLVDDKGREHRIIKIEIDYSTHVSLLEVVGYDDQDLQESIKQRQPRIRVMALVNNRYYEDIKSRLPNLTVA